MKVYEVTPEQKTVLDKEVMHGTQTFNCVLNAGDTPLDEDGFHVLDKTGELVGKNRKYFISQVQIDNCQYNELYHDWIHALPEIDYNPVLIKV